MRRYKSAYCLVLFSLIVIWITIAVIEQLTPIALSERAIIIALLLIWPLLKLNKIRQHIRNLSGPNQKQYQQYCKLFKQILPIPRRILSALGLKPTPTYLIIGTPQSGKTQLLEPTFPLNNKCATCQIYRHNKNLLLDTPGINNSDQATWLLPLLQALQHNRYNMPLQSILITIDTKQINQEFTTQLVKFIAIHLKKVFNKNQWPSIQLMITKCDDIPQFVSCFKDLTTQDKQEKFGLMFKQKNVIHNPEQAFNRRFSQLLDHIEQYTQHKEDCQNLVNHFNTLNQPLLELTKNISSSSLYLRGIFFSSTRTEPPLFSLEWLQQNHTKPIIYCQKRKHETIAAAIIIILLSIAITHKIFLDNQQQVALIQNQLQQPAHTQDPTLAKLNNLEKTKSVSQHNATQTFKLDQVKQFESQIIDEYNKTLTNDFLQKITHILESSLAKLSSNTIKDFSVYMMLCSNQTRNNQAITEWFDSYWQKNTVPFERTDYIRHLNKLLTLKTNCSINHPLIAKAKSYLDNIPTEQLILALAQTEIKNDDNNNIKTRNTTNSSSNSYTYQLFHKMLDQTIEQSYIALQKYHQKELEQNVLENSKQLYIKNYLNHWQQKLNSITITQFSTVKEAALITNKLQDENTGLANTLAIISNNTSQPEDPVFTQLITKNFNKTSPLPNQEMQVKLNEWLQQLNQYVEQMNNGSNSTIMAFKLSKDRMEKNPQDALSYLNQHTKDYPPMISTWLNQLTQQTWQAMLTEAHAYINKQWQDKVLPSYKTKIKDYFPFSSKATQDIEASNFTDFFGKQGAITEFISTYIKPFIKQDTGIWTWKKLDGISISNKKDTIEALMTANIIHNMFFSSAASNLPKYSLSIEKISLSDSLEKLTFSWENNEIAISKEKKPTIQFNIPMSSSALTINFQNNKNMSTSRVYTGTWAWLKALQSVTSSHTSNDTKSLTVQIEHQDETAKLTITADHKNPITLRVFENIYFPEIL